MSGYLSQRERQQVECRARFDRADELARSVVASLAMKRSQRRDHLRKNGTDPEAVLAERIGHMTDVLHQHFAPHGVRGFRLTGEPNPFDDDSTLDAADFVPHFKAAVWELWRDYSEWPDGHQVVDRLATWLGITTEQARKIELAARSYRWKGQHFEAEPATFAGTLTTARLLDYRWYFTDVAEAYFQEELYQWFQLLEDDGYVYRASATGFAHDHRKFWRLPA